MDSIRCRKTESNFTDHTEITHLMCLYEVTKVTTDYYFIKIFPSACFEKCHSSLR